MKLFVPVHNIKSAYVFVVVYIVGNEFVIDVWGNMYSVALFERLIQARAHIGFSAKYIRYRIGIEGVSAHSGNSRTPLHRGGMSSPGSGPNSSSAAINSRHAAILADTWFSARDGNVKTTFVGPTGICGGISKSKCNRRFSGISTVCVMVIREVYAPSGRLSRGMDLWALSRPTP